MNSLRDRVRGAGVRRRGRQCVLTHENAWSGAVRDAGGMSLGSAARHRCTLIARTKAASASESCALDRALVRTSPPLSALKIDEACRVPVPREYRRPMTQAGTQNAQHGLG